MMAASLVDDVPCIFHFPLCKMTFFGFFPLYEQSFSSFFSSSCVIPATFVYVANTNEKKVELTFLDYLEMSL